MVNLNEYQSETVSITVTHAAAHDIIVVDGVSSNETVDITSGFVTHDYKVEYDGKLYNIINFFVDESESKPGLDTIRIAGFEIAREK